MEPGERDELELVAHRAQLALELGDRRVIEVALPVERRRAVIRQHLLRVLPAYPFGEALRKAEIRRPGLAPHHVRVLGVRQSPGQGLVEPFARLVEALRGALAGDERLVVFVDVARDDVGSFGIGAGEDNGGHAHDVGGEARGDQLLYRFLRRHQHLAAHVAALLHGSELVLVVHARGAGFDHRLHQLEGVEHAAEPRFGVGDDRREPVDVPVGLHGLDLVRAQQRIVDASDYRGHRGDGVQRLVWIHLERVVRVRRDLPAREIDRRNSRAHLLHRLVARERAERVDVWPLVHELPQLLCAEPCERVLDLYAAAQANDILSAVAALDASPTRVLGPVFSYCFDHRYGSSAGDWQSREATPATWRAATRHTAYFSVTKTRLYIYLGQRHFMIRHALSNFAASRHLARTLEGEVRLPLHERAVALDGHEDAGADEECKQRRAAVREEGERHPDDRENARHHSHVDEGIGKKHQAYRAGKKTREKRG